LPCLSKETWQEGRKSVQGEKKKKKS